MNLEIFLVRIEKKVVLLQINVLNIYCTLQYITNIITDNSMAGFQTPITIKQAIDRIRNKSFLLPAFQREYVWSSMQVENLFDSLMKGYPISSMLLWKVSGDAKQSYKFYQVLERYVQLYHTHNDPFNTNQVNDFHAVLDGQQRLTSLYLGLCGTYAYHKYRARWDNVEGNFPTRILYLNISRTFPEDEGDKTYNFSFKEESTTKGLNLFTDSNTGDHWFRVGYILEIGDGFSQYDVEDFGDDNELIRSERKMLRQLKSVIFDVPSINYYEVDKSTPDEAVNIFVRINSGGTSLSFSNILMSIAIAGWQKKDARTEINNLVDTINNKGFNITQDYILKSFLYLYRNDVRFRIKSFDNNFVALIEDNWDGIRDCIDELFELLRTFGLDRSSLTSNNATLPILYYLYHTKRYRDFSTSISYREDRENIRIWLMKTLLFRTFGSSGDRMLQLSRKAYTGDIASEFIEPPISYFPANEISAAAKQPTVLTDEFIDNNLLTIHKDNGYAFALLSLIYSNLDYRNSFHKDHIHPYSSCSEAGLDWNQYDTILNLQMLDANENMSKNAKSLKDWIETETNDTNRLQFLKSHIIPDVNLDLSNFDEFIQERRITLHERIKSIFNTCNVEFIDENIEDFEEEIDI